MGQACRRLGRMLSTDDRLHLYRVSLVSRLSHHQPPSVLLAMFPRSKACKMALVTHKARLSSNHPSRVNSKWYSSPYQRTTRHRRCLACSRAELPQGPQCQHRRKSSLLNCRRNPLRLVLTARTFPIQRRVVHLWLLPLTMPACHRWEPRLRSPQTNQAWSAQPSPAP